MNGIGSKLFSFVLWSYFTQGVVKTYDFIRPGSVSFPVHPKGAGWSLGQCAAQPKQILSEAPFVCVCSIVMFKMVVVGNEMLKHFGDFVIPDVSELSLYVVSARSANTVFMFPEHQVM